MNVTRASNSAAAIEIAANRSPIGKPTIFLTQTARLLRSSARQASRARRLSDLGGSGGGAASSTSRALGHERHRDGRAGRRVAHLLERRLAGERHRLVLGLRIGEVDAVAHDLERQRGAGEQPDVVAGAGGADRQAGEDEVLLRAVEDGVEPGAELGERARVARELAVDAVEGERELEQDRAGDHPPALAGGEAGRGEQPDEHRERGDAVRRPATVAPPSARCSASRARRRTW